MDAGHDSAVFTDASFASDGHYVPADASYDDNVVVYAHSASTLFSFDPRTNTVTRIGDFAVAGAFITPDMTDLAVDHSGHVYTCSYDAIYSVNATTAAATQLVSLSGLASGNFNGLTFIPVGVLDSTQEVLVGATSNGEFYRVDLSSGAVTMIGQYSDGYGSSGDIVSVGGAGTFATVTRGDLDTNLLVRVDVTNGHVTPIGTGIGFVNIYGLGYWRNRLYGFDNSGNLIDINIDTGVGTLISSTTGADSYYGAGVTTSAPILQ